MNTFGVELVWLAIRVTVVATVALGLVAWCGRRGARSGVVVLAGSMVVLLMLSLAALVPLPDAWRWTVIETARGVKAPDSANEPTDLAVSRPDPNVQGKSFFAHALDWLGTRASNQESAPGTEK